MILDGFAIILFFSMLALLAAIYLFIRELQFHKFLHSYHTQNGYEPFASVIAPVRGLHSHMEGSIRALLRQNYKKYEVIFVLDDRRDPAYAVIKNILKEKAKSKKYARIILTKKNKNYYGKIAALVSGVDASRGQALVFYDADSKPRPSWLRDMVAPLSDARIGVTSGYRFYAPANSFASYLRNAWNNIGLVLLWARHSYIWGGSVAMLRKRFEELRIRDAWRNAMSDDSIITMVFQKSKYKIFFVPTCILTTSGEVAMKEFNDFATRQATIVKYHFKRQWLTAVAFLVVLNAFTAAGILLLFMSLFWPQLLLPAILFLSVAIVEVISAMMRYKGLSRYGKVNNLRKYLVVGFLGSWAMSYSAIKAANSDKIIWRGRIYHMKGPYDLRVETKGFE